MLVWIAATAIVGTLLRVPALAQSDAPLTDRERALLERVGALEKRLAEVEKRLNPAVAEKVESSAGAREAAVRPAVTDREAKDRADPVAGDDAGRSHDWLRDTTLNFSFDGYYAWNGNRPPGRINLLRVYDGTANSFSINQAGMVVERAVDAGQGRRWGYRLDLMYGQATETLQGSPLNEPRPQVYRPVFQAYGTYVVPVGKGLTVDFGKWASALGPEGNYTKDQINYSRSYFFGFLPFYHMGFRSSYALHDRVSVAYWLVNGANQAEEFNGFKSQLGQAVIKPSRNLTWTLNYYVGREQPDGASNGGQAGLIAPQGGFPAARWMRANRGRLHVIDTYAFWNLSRRLVVGGEFDTVIHRVEAGTAPQRVTGGAAYLRYQLTPRLSFGQRYVRLHDRAGLFSGVSQTLNDWTSTIGFRPSEGFEARVEYRRDFSNVPFFVHGDSGSSRRNQQTFTLGLLWWLGGKAGNW